MSISVEVFPSKCGNSPVIYLNSFGDEGRAVHEEVGRDDYCLVVVSGLEWNTDMCPWPCPPLRRKDPGCIGGADEYIRRMEKEIIPSVEKDLGKATWRAIAGYSLGGLFALYTLYRTDLFSRAASVSGSLWYPDFLDFASSHEFWAPVSSVYLSVGEMEARGKNPVFRSVVENTEKLYKHYRSIGLDTFFQLNPGGHNTDAVKRTADAISWLLRQGR